MGASAWDAANMAAAAADVTFRPLTTLEDADAILRVMIATWGNHQLLPREMIMALAEAGDVPGERGCEAFAPPGWGRVAHRGPPVLGLG